MIQKYSITTLACVPGLNLRLTYLSRAREQGTVRIAFNAEVRNAFRR
jgi:hypothetical protein